MFLSKSSNMTTATEFSSGDISWTLTCSTLVWLMVPGVGFFYSGMARSKSALSLIVLCCWSIAVVSVQWYLFGYSLTFSRTGTPIIGDLSNAFLMNVGHEPYPTNPRIPEILYCIYQGMIAGITPALVIGATAERGRFMPTLIFMFLWTTFVYDVIAHWTWNCNGWSQRLGGRLFAILDFAGGMPVHIASGAAAVAYSHILGVREGSLVDYKPHNVVQVVLGTSLIWFGWFGFNGGSAQGSNTRAVFVLVVTNLSASVGGITWALMDFRKERKFSALSFCFGAVAGLVLITPGSGFITPTSAIIFGFVGSLGCHFAINLKERVGLDDALDVVGVHGIGGIIGTLLTGIFADRSVSELDGVKESNIEGGWMNENWMQLPYQLAGILAATTWSLCVTFLILFVMNKIPGLQLRADARTVKAGLDRAEIGESAYEKIPDPDGV